MNSSSNWTYPSNSELYYAPDARLEHKLIELPGAEAHHLFTVKRNTNDSVVFVTNGKGNCFECKVLSSEKYNNSLEILNVYSCENTFESFVFFIPVLKSNERMEIALEKLIELGFTNFVFYSSDRGLARSPKLQRFEKIAISAMKQSLRLFRPNLLYQKELRLPFNDKNILFDKDALQYLSRTDFAEHGRCNVIIGPEGGFSKREMESFTGASVRKLNEARLRSETAAIIAGSQISSLF